MLLLLAVLVAIAGAFCCGLIFGFLGIKSDICRDVVLAISSVVFLVCLIAFLRWEKRSGFALRRSVAIVQHFSHRHDHDA